MGDFSPFISDAIAPSFLFAQIHFLFPDHGIKTPAAFPEGKEKISVADEQHTANNEEEERTVGKAVNPVCDGGGVRHREGVKRHAGEGE